MLDVGIVSTFSSNSSAVAKLRERPRVNSKPGRVGRTMVARNGDDFPRTGSVVPVEGSVLVPDQAGRKRRRSLGSTLRKAPASVTASTTGAGRKPMVSVKLVCSTNSSGAW